VRACNSVLRECITALTLFVGGQVGHPAYVRSCFSNPCRNPQNQWQAHKKADETKTRLAPVAVRCNCDISIHLGKYILLCFFLYTINFICGAHMNSNFIMYFYTMSNCIYRFLWISLDFVLVTSIVVCLFVITF